MVAIVAVVAGLAAPGLGRAMAERRANQAMLDVVRLARRGRSEAAAFGRAHLLRFSDADSGSVQLYRGLNNGCNSNAWGALVGGGCAGNPMCLGEVLMADYARPASSIDMTLLPEASDVDICFQPSGAMMWLGGGNTSFTSDNVISGGFIFRLTPRDGEGEVRGVIRNVLLPLGGEARVLR